MSVSTTSIVKQQNNSFAGSTYVQWGSKFLPDIWPATQSFLATNIALAHPVAGGRAGARVKLQSDTVEYSPLIVDLLLDRDFELYNVVYQNFIEHLNVNNSKFAPAPFDLWMSVIGHDGTEICKWNYYNCRVEDISEFSVDTTSNDEPIPLALTIIYDHMDFKLIT